MTQLYPRPKREKNFIHRWRVDYNLAYDGGGTRWSGYYHFKFIALIAAWWNVHISSWGGTVFLYDQWESRV